MKYCKLGRTGLDVSRICLGTMGFGDGSTQSWTVDEEAARGMIKKAIDGGINFIDTANVYSYGKSEEIVGRAIRDFGLREEIVLATKFYSDMRPGRPNGGGASRKEIFHELDESLKRLGTDYVDLYILHRWDYSTPIEETMEALNDVVRMGKVRYIGASAMFAWQFIKARNIAEKHGWANFISMQDHYNLLYREEEREMAPYCIDAGVALTPYKSLAAGRLARDRKTVTKRLQEDRNATLKYYGKTEEEDGVIIDRVGEVAERNGLSRIDVAIGWLLQKQPVASAICGVTKESHVDGLLHAAETVLSAEDMAYLEEAYVPHEYDALKLWNSMDTEAKLLGSGKGTHQSLK